MKIALVNHQTLHTGLFQVITLTEKEVSGYTKTPLSTKLKVDFLRKLSTKLKEDFHF